MMAQNNIILEVTLILAMTMSIQVAGITLRRGNFTDLTAKTRTFTTYSYVWCDIYRDYKQNIYFGGQPNI